MADAVGDPKQQHAIILHTATGHRSIGHNAAIAVGSTVALLGLFSSPISGSSMNPARTLGPDIVGANFTGWWVYVFGDLIGAAIAVMIIILVRGLPVKQETEAAPGSAGRRVPDGPPGQTWRATPAAPCLIQKSRYSKDPPRLPVADLHRPLAQTVAAYAR